VEAAIFSTEGQLVSDSLRVFYRTNLGTFQALEMVPSGGANLYHAFIPAQQLGTLVQYYVLGRDEIGNRTTHPEGAPGSTHGFVVGTLTTTVNADMESDPGWSLGPSTATAGLWERVDPIEVLRYVGGIQFGVTPEDDTTPAPGVLCWVTEQEDVGGLAGDHDVDNGYTTLHTEVYDLGNVDYARVLYSFWFSNDLGGHPAEDAFDFDVSTDGGATWTSIESTTESTYYWGSRRFELTNHVPLTGSMRFRFVARDDQSAPQGPSLVEAAIDDFMILTWTGGATGIEDPASAAPARTELTQNRPNPFNPSTRIGFALGTDGRVALRIYDVEGTLVRTLLDGARPAGQHAVTWDGTTDGGAPAASGVYFYRLEANDVYQTRKMTMVR
ncbi:MAG: FlgD immunoglobulin-like domain containing protein, partial [Candidatus Eiseniibacteriota bacterium]